MGGKNKQSQRTKNNVRPSSSGRSAELLSSASGSHTPFAGTSSQKPFPVLFPTLKAAVETEQSLNADFVLCIKRLNKKDPITKVKALQELTELVKKSDVEDVVLFLPVWTRIYTQLSMDPDHKVRENIQICFGSILTLCGRRVGPHLRTLLAAWLTAARDSHAPAASQAERILRTTFPEAKLPEVIAFCKEEVMNTFIENLTGDVDSLLANRSLSPDALAQHRIRITLCSLQGIQFVAELLPRAHDEWFQTKMDALFGDKKFWQLANHEDVTVRASWFVCTSRLVPRGAVSGPARARLPSLCVVAARDPDVALAPPLWTCLLLLMATDKDWYDHIKNKKEFVNRVLDLVSNGGWGDAKKLCDMILPLLAHLPQDILDQNFYQRFFEALYKGLKKKSILNSKSERQAWITSIGECLRYVSLQNAEYTIDVATCNHRGWLDTVLNINHDISTSQHLVKCSASNMTGILKYWMKQTENVEKFDSLIRNFWQNLCSITLSQIEKLSINDDDITNTIESHTILIQTIRTAYAQEVKIKKSLRFDDDSTANENNVSKQSEQCIDNFSERFAHNLNDFAFKVCCQYLEFAKTNKNTQTVLKSLLNLINTFDSKGLFEAISRHFTGAASVALLYRNVFNQWLKDDGMRCQELVELVFLMVKYLGDDEEKMVFDSFSQLSRGVCEWCVCAALEHRRGGQWLQSAAALAGIDSLCAGTKVNLLLAHVAACDSILPPTAIARMVSTFTAALQHEHQGLETSASAAARMLSILAADGTYPCADLLIQMFSVLIDNQHGIGDITTETWQEVRSACEDVILTMDNEQYDLIRDKCIQQLHDKLFDNKQALNIPLIDHIASISTILIRNSNYNQETVQAIVSLTKHLFNFNVKHEDIQYYALRLDGISLKLNFLFEDDSTSVKNVIQTASEVNQKEIDKLDLICYTNKVLFRTSFLKTLVKNGDDSKESESASETETNWCDLLMEESFGVKEMANVLHEYSIVYSLFDGYAFWQHYEIIQKAKNHFDFLLREILEMTSQKSRVLIGQYLSNQCDQFGFYWAYALCHFKEKCQSVPPPRLCTDSTDQSLKDDNQEKGERNEVIDELNVNKKDSNITGNGYFHNMQASSQSVESKCHILLRCLHLTFPEQCKDLLELAQTDLNVDSALDAVINAYYEHNEIMLYERELNTASWQHALSNACVVDYLTCVLTERGWEARDSHWDFATISVCSLLTSLCMSHDHWGSTQVALIARPVFRLLKFINEFIKSVPERCMKQQPSDHVAKLPSEWKDIFAPDIYNSLTNIVRQISESPKSMSLSVPQAIYLEALTSVTSVFSLPPSPFSPATMEAMADSIAALLESVCHHGYKFLAYHLLRSLDAEFLRNDGETVQRCSEVEDGGTENRRPLSLSLHRFDAAFSTLQALVDDALSHVNPCAGTCEIEPHSESFAVALSLCVGQAAVLDMGRRARGDLPTHYMHYYNTATWPARLLDAALRLLPSLDAHELNTRYGTCFDNMPTYTLTAPPTSTLVSTCACRLVLLTVTSSSTGRARAAGGRVLDALLRGVLAPREIHRQLSELQAHRHLFTDTQITIHWSTSEVECVHRIEERSITLHIKLSPLHPLHPPTVEASHFNVQWLVVYIAYQSGSILEGVSLWCRSVTSKVQAAPVCYVCYSRLQPARGTLPRATCHTCHNKFHADCLQKWFTTSKKSSCPLCRADFI